MVKQEMLFTQLSHHKNLDARWIMCGEQDDIDAFSEDIIKTTDPRTSKFADIEIEATVGKSKNDVNWHTQKFDLVELFKTVSVLRVDHITQKKYEGLSDKDRSNLKNGPAIVGSTLWVNDSNRKSENIRTRTMLTFDIDEPQRSDKLRTFDEMFSHIQEVLKSIFGYDVFFFVYTSRNATQQKPRMRIMLPFDREIVEDNVKIKNKKGELVDYTDMLTSVAVSRFIASKLGIDMFDHTCHEVARLMYYPSTCSDGWFRSAVNLADILKTDDLVNAMKNDGINITDREDWPQSKFETKVLEPLIAFVKDREDGELTEQSEKPGLIGAFNTVFTPDLAIEEFLSDVYTDHTINRYTYIDGSSQGGLQYYEDSELVYSRHATDPLNDGHSHNSYDLVRIHLFGDDDDSMGKMNKFIRENCEEVVKLAEERKRDERTQQNENVTAESEANVGNLYEDEWLQYEKGKPVFAPSAVAATFYKYNQCVYWANPDGKKDDYYYDEKSGVWVKNGQSWLDDQIRTMYLWGLGKEADIARVVKDTRALYRQENKNLRSMRFPLANEEKIVLANGVYDTKTGEFNNEFDSSLYAIMNFPTVKYDQNAECQLFLEFIDHLFGPEQRSFVLAWMGYCMTSTYKYQHILMINGEGGIGKGTFITILQTLLNAYDADPDLSAVSAVKLTSLTSDKFAGGGLIGKTANIDGETKSGFHKFSEMLKSLSGGDSISMEKKGKDAEFRPNTAKLIFVGNGELSFKDNLSALLRRFHYLRCVPTDRSQNDPRFHDIHKKIQNSQEMLAGVFNAAMSAYREMVAWCEDNSTNFWNLPEKVEADTTEWIQTMDILGQFIEEENEFFEKTDDANDVIHYQAMYDMYRTTMDMNGQAKLGENNFSREMANHGMSKTRIKRFGRVLQGYRGFKIKKAGYLLRGITSSNGRTVRAKQGTWQEFGFSG